MPYARKFKKVFKRKTYRKKRGVTKAVKQYVKKEIRIAPEPKWFENTLVNQVFNATGFIAGLSSTWPVQGLNFYARVGDQIRLKNYMIDFKFSGCFAATQATFQPFTTVRMILAYMKTPNGNGLPALADVLDLGLATPTQAPINSTKRSEFHIISDRSWTMTGNFLTAAGVSNTFVSSGFKHIRKTVRLGKTQKFLTNAGTHASVMNVLPFILLVSDTAAGYASPQFNMYTKLNYTDP